jgi:hypothetical protein
MASNSLSTAHLDYLQRNQYTPDPSTLGDSWTSATPELRRLLRVHGIGQAEKTFQPKPWQGERMLSEDVLVGLYGYKIPLAFLVWGEPQGIAIHMGTWSPSEREHASADALDARQQILSAVLSGLYPAIDLEPVPTDLKRPPVSGFALGVPTVKPPDPLDGARALDRLIRALSGTNWAFLILAEAVDESVTSDLRHSTINEMRSVSAAAEATKAPSPLAKHYTELLETQLKALSQGQAIGVWRTAVYLLGDQTSYYRLASTWRATFSGDQSLPEPIRTWDSPRVSEWASAWSMPDAPGHEGPSYYRHPFAYQSLLTSSQLAAYIHLPQLETNGFAVDIVPDFDAVPPKTKVERPISLGNVIHRTQSTEAEYCVSPKTLTRHTFIAGVTGAGKTNTIFHLLKEAHREGVPFLVIEPAKTEYRSLLNEVEFADTLQVFTLGDETVAPFRLNPFEVLAGTPVSVHIDLLRSVFAASFGMWTPLPQIMEQCLHRIYTDRGWDITSNTNHRLEGETQPAEAFPNLTELVAAVDDVTRALGYENEFTANARAALNTRINSLRTGGKGRMLDVQHSLPMHVILEQPTVLELEGMGDDDDKAFLMGLILIRLAEYRRSQGQADSLTHLLVIEEAHRLLTNVGGPSREEEANPRGKAVESFANLLSEVRAYGQGVIVADQVPVKLAPDVIKNTNLKISHRVVAQDDRMTLAGAMAMNERQARAVATLPLGRAVMFSEGDDAPLLVQVPLAKFGADSQIAGSGLKQAWQGFRDRYELAGVYHTYPSCGDHCQPINPRCNDARRLAEDPTVETAFAATILTLVAAGQQEESVDLAVLLSERIQPLMRSLHARSGGHAKDPTEIRCAVAHALHNYITQMGARYGWDYPSAEGMKALLLTSLLDAALDRPMTGAGDLHAFCQAYTDLCELNFDPFYGCAQVCPGGQEGGPRQCLYRHSVEPITLSDHFDEAYRSQEWDPNGLVRLARRYANRVLQMDDGTDAFRSAALCFLIQHVHRDEHLDMVSKGNLIDDVVVAYEESLLEADGAA